MAMATHRSTLSTESPPFNPNRVGGMMGSPSGAYGAGSRSRSTSPHPRSSSPYPGGDNAIHSQSNAVPKYEFQYQG